MTAPIGTCDVEIQQVNHGQSTTIDRVHLTWKAAIRGLSLRNWFPDSMFHPITRPVDTDQCTLERLLW